ncbi:MAG: S49 family peptidase, partial [Alphaproteobacteria bacterium]
MRIWNKLASEPWAITESALAMILEIAERENEKPEAVAARLGRELKNTHHVTERDGVAVIPVTGPLFRSAKLFTQVSGATSYEMLAQYFTAALEHPDIHAIILTIDSPGGEVNGCAELANMIFAARGRKPILAYASGDAASGAYWIASAADEIVVSETSGLG